MKNLTYIVLAAVTAVTLGLTTMAQAGGYRDGGGYGRNMPQHRFEKHVDRRQARQWDRIRDGIDNGDLSRKELRRLARDQRRIARMEKRFERDGYYSPRERRKLARALDRSSHRIKQAKHNDHHRPHRGWRGRHHGHYVEPYAYEEADESYVYGSLSSTTVTAQANGFSVSWSTHNQD